MKRVALVQVRMGSTRLPGKALLPAAGKPLLHHLLDRLKSAQRVDAVGVATTVRPEDDAIEDLCQKVGVLCHRGSAEDVLGRVREAMHVFGGDLHVELHGDGPFVDPRVVDKAIQLFEEGGADLVTNALRVTYPPGLEVWVYTRATLERVEREAKLPEYRESPALFLAQHPTLFRLRNFEAPPSLYAPDIYLEVDTVEDFTVTSAVFEALTPENPNFLTEDVLSWLRARPSLRKKNRFVERRWKAFLPRESL